MGAKWIVAELSAEEEARAGAFSEALGISLVLSRLLVKRGLEQVEEAEAFLRPKLKHLPAPYLMQGMREAVHYLKKCIRSKKHIMLTGDQDVDGVTSVALIHNILRDVFGHGDYVHYYIPKGNDEGYGISRKCIEEALLNGCELLIATDTGIKAMQEVAYARQLGLEVIICDHHHVDDALPKASAILNPKQAHCQYPNKHLSGCGVAYKLMQALAIEEKKELSKLYNYLDLLALSTAADLVPIIGENRTLLVHGLHQINSHPSIGVQALLELVHISPGEHIDMSSIIYKIAPRLNAAGRMQEGQIAVDLLTASTPSTAQKLCRQIEAYNNERRLLDTSMTEEAKQLIAEDKHIDSRPIIVLYQAHWHMGVMGIVAARIAERYRRPAIILTKSGKTLTGSGRSSRPINLYDAIDSCRDLLINFGGHKYAAGLTIKEEDLPKLQSRLEQHILSQRQEEDCPDRSIQIDAILSIEEITPELEQELKLLEPFGLKNERPVFATFRLRDAGGSKTTGREGQHLKLRMTDRYCKYRPLNGIALNQSQHIKWVTSQQAFGICYTMEESTHHSIKGLVLNIKDISTTPTYNPS